ncbi:MAG: DUF3108 domain-containing protein, partial [Terracidiphilus sp.]
MNLRAHLAILFCCLSCAAAGQAPLIHPLPPPDAGFTFPQKQTLTYSVDWRVFPAGTAVIRFEADGDHEHVNATAYT